MFPTAKARAIAFGKGKPLYRQYQERLKALNAADFGDLLLETLHYPASTNPDILADYRDRFRYMLVDEYQDTNVVQYLWLKICLHRAGQAMSAWWATTTRASMAGAARRWKTSCASSAIFPAPR